MNYLALYHCQDERPLKVIQIVLNFQGRYRTTPGNITPYNWTKVSILSSTQARNSSIGVLVIFADEMGRVKRDMVEIFTFTLSNSFCQKHPKL